MEIFLAITQLPVVIKLFVQLVIGMMLWTSLNKANEDGNILYGVSAFFIFLFIEVIVLL